MALGEMRRTARFQAITTAAENARSYGEEGSCAEDHQMSEEECKKLADFLDKKADKLMSG